jgi:mRNA interferase MazF
MSYHFGDVVFAKLDEPSKKPEEASREIKEPRPAIIIQNENQYRDLPTLLIVPFTKNLANLRFSTSFEVVPNSNGLAVPSAALPFQIMAIDKRKILCKTGELEEAHKKLLKERLHGLIDG